MSRWIAVVAALAVGAAAAPGVARPDTTTEQQKVIVTASRLAPAPAAPAPANVTVITADDIRRSPARTVPELLTLEAGVITRSLYGNHASQSTVDLRGFGMTAGQNTLILLNGRRLNDIDLAAVDFAAVPLENIARIEVIRGAGGVLYGDGAVGGAINIVTKEPSRTGTTGTVKAIAGSHAERGLDVALSRVSGDVAMDIHAHGLHSNGYRANNDLEQRNAQFNVDWYRPQGEYYLRGGFNRRTEGLPGPRTVDPAAGVNELADSRRGTDTPHDFANQKGGFATLGTSRYLSAHTQVVLDAGYRIKDQQAFYDDYTYGGQYANYVDTRLATWSITPRLEFTHGLGALNADTRAGIDFYDSDYRSDRSLNPATAGTPVHRLSVTQTSTSVYTDTAFDAGAATRVTAGARFQYVALTAQDAFNPAAPGAAYENQAADLNNSHWQHMLELGARHRLGDAWSIYARLNRSVRFWTVDEVFQFDPNTFLRAFTPLKPQVSRSAEIGGDWQPKGIKVHAGGYYMKLNNEIHYDPATFSNVNLDATERYGAELSFSVRVMQRVRVTGNYNYTRSRFTQGRYEGNNVPMVPRHTAALSVLYDVSGAVTLAATERYTGARYFDNDQTNTFMQIPSYAMLDLKAATSAGKWRFTADLHNVLGVKAYDYGVRSLSTPGKFNAYPLPQREFNVSVSRSL